jgi:hypothetical protein
MSANSEYGTRPSWFKENLSQILLFFAMLMIVVNIVVYFFSDALSKLIFPVEQPVTQKTLVHKAPAPVITENWDKDELGPIENTPHSVGVSDLNGKRVVISKEELLGLEQRYRIDLVEVEKKQVQDLLNSQAMPEDNNDQANLALLERAQSPAPESEIIHKQNNARNNRQAEIPLSIQTKEQLSLLNLKLLSRETLLSKSPYLFTLRLSAMETQEQLLAFIEQYDLPAEDIYVYLTISNNKPLYVILLGEYRSFPAAKIAQQALPRSFFNLPSQVLLYKEIQQDLQLNND